MSTKEENEQRQMIALQKFGVTEQNVFVDKQSGKSCVNYRLRFSLCMVKADTVAVSAFAIGERAIL